MEHYVVESVLCVIWMTWKVCYIIESRWGVDLFSQQTVLCQVSRESSVKLAGSVVLSQQEVLF